MKKNNLSYFLTALFFSIGFLGFTFFAAAGLYSLWFASLAIGILCFVFRIISGDD